MPKAAAAARPAAKPATKKKEAKGKDATKAKSGDRIMYAAGAAGVGFVALLIGSAHMLKRARRAARARGPMSEEEKAAEEAARWVVSERTMALVAGGLLLLGVLVTLGVVFGQRVRDKYAAMREAARERAALRELKARKEKERVESHAARLAAREAARKRQAEEKAAQEAFEAGLMAEIEAMRRANREEEARAAQQRLEESQAAYAEARRLEEEMRLRQQASGKGGGSSLYDDDDWDIGEWENAEEYAEAEAEAEAAPAEEEEDDDDDEDDDEKEPQMLLEDRPAAKGTRLSLEGLSMAPAQTARPAELWVQLGCARCGQPSELLLSGLRASQAEAKAWCDKCGCMLSASLRPTLLHPDSAVMGHVDTSNCSVMDVPRLSLLAHCPRCFEDCPLPELARGRRSQKGCFSCHAPVWVQLNAVTCQMLGGAAGGKAKAKGGEEEEDEMEQLLKKVGHHPSLLHALSCPSASTLASHLRLHSSRPPSPPPSPPTLASTLASTSASHPRLPPSPPSSPPPSRLPRVSGAQEERGPVQEPRPRHRQAPAQQGRVLPLQALLPLAPLPLLRPGAPLRHLPRAVRLPRRLPRRVGQPDGVRQVLARDAVLGQAVRALRQHLHQAGRRALAGGRRLPRPAPPRQQGLSQVQGRLGGRGQEVVLAEEPPGGRAGQGEHGGQEGGEC